VSDVTEALITMCYRLHSVAVILTRLINYEVYRSEWCSSRDSQHGLCSWM